MHVGENLRFRIRNSPRRRFICIKEIFDVSFNNNYVNVLDELILK